MAKKLLHQFHVRAAHPFRKQRLRKLVIRLVKKQRALSKGLFPISKIPLLRQEPSPSNAEISILAARPHWWRWSLAWLTIVGILGGSGIIGGLLLTSIPPAPECDRFNIMAADSDRLYCAQIAAQSGQLDKLVAAMSVIEGWPATHPLYPQAQIQMTEWSQAILKIARQKLNEGNLNGAVNIANKIPERSPFYQEAQSKIATWQRLWKQSDGIVGDVQTALKTQNWLTASSKIQELSDIKIDYWQRDRTDELMKQLSIEKEAWQQFQQAEALAQSNTALGLEEAISLASKISSTTYIKPQIQAQRINWSRALINIASQRFAEQDYAGVAVVLQRIPADTPVYAEAQDWIRLGRSYTSAAQNHLFALVDALAAIRQIDRKSPIYSIAQQAQSRWQSQLQDVVSLQLASTLASFGQPMAFQMAINQAKLITPNRPKVQEAQSLISEWSQQLQKISDRTALAEAKQLAKPGKIDNLRAAVAKASEIELGQPLRGEAQTAIAMWTKQIQTIEDQPILDLARVFAQQGDLIAAVQAAKQIRPGRALYPESSKMINQWVEQIQLAEDRITLESAMAAASQGNLTIAIQTASQISPGRPLYEEAQAEITRWYSQLPPPTDSLPPATENYQQPSDNQ